MNSFSWGVSCQLWKRSEKHAYRSQGTEKRDSWPSWLSCLQFFKCTRLLDVCHVKVNVDPRKQFLMTSLPNLENDTNKSQAVSRHPNNWRKRERRCCHSASHWFNWMNTHSPGLEEVRLHQAEWSGMCSASGIADGC